MPNDENFGRGKNTIIHVYWNDATTFSEWLVFKLPTDAQWEYACKTGSSLPFTAEGLTIDDVNLDGEAGGITRVGSYPSNAWGLNDMIGNVNEWFSDCINRLPSEPQIDSKGLED